MDIGTASISCCDMWCVVVCRFIKHRYVMDWSLLKKKLFLFYFYSNLTDVSCVVYNFEGAYVRMSICLYVGNTITFENPNV